MNTQSQNQHLAFPSIIIFGILFALWSWVMGWNTMFTDKYSTASNPKPSTFSQPQTSIPTQSVYTTPSIKAESIQLKLATEITSVTFDEGQTTLDAASLEKISIFASKPETLSAFKIHVKGYSGNRSVKSQERRKLAFERAFSVKMALTSTHGYAPEKIRIFYFPNDHFGHPRSEFNSFPTQQDAEKDAKLNLNSIK